MMEDLKFITAQLEANAVIHVKISPFSAENNR
jgi:hypothetical protein